MPEHQKALDALKDALWTALVLGYPDFYREFLLETDVSLQGLGAMLSRNYKDGKLCGMTYAS